MSTHRKLPITLHTTSLNIRQFYILKTYFILCVLYGSQNISDHFLYSIN